ncbi:MAG TPA: M1 family metallopeptidase [Kofleriaceae bacterium]|nr:M1 family metallopeptidase [Kofleriaceae bacterium]
MRRAVLLVFVLVACRGSKHPAPEPIKRDPHSFSEPSRVSVRHVGLDLTVDFDQRVLHGTAQLALARHDRSANLVLDVDGLAIASVRDCATHAALVFQHAPKKPVLGQALSIALAPATACVEIAYRTGPDASALLWVEPAGTVGKKHPMLFTQSQAIRARSWIPLQDTPGVRFTYDATIHIPDGLWAVMSATNPQSPPADHVWRFHMAQPIPSYLMALAVGELGFRALGPRTGVYAEPAMLDAAANEFVEVEAMMKTAEQLYGPYRWDRYDLLVLPPSFPYGGMENPRLTFLTPTVITGDRTLVSLIAHELAHSWSGNLVTNSTWSDFWLNEGFTTYVERRIMEALRGREAADILWYLGRKDLEQAFAKSGADRDTRLALELTADRDPDDVPSDAAYEKGALLLRTLEQAFGRTAFDAFLRRRFDRRAFQSTDTAAFETDLRSDLMARLPGKWSERALAAWIHEPGLPPSTPATTSRRVAELEAIATDFAKNASTFSTDGWQTLEWVIFLRSLPADIAPARLRTLDERHHLTASPNAEIAMYWLPLLVRADARDAAPTVERYLAHVGRRRMITPLYEAMVDKGEPWRTLAKKTFERAKPLYHPIVRDSIAKLVGR